MIKLIQLLKLQLGFPLPGVPYQLKLAPESRSVIIPAQQKIDAGVLLLIFPNSKNEPSLVFMKRASYDGHHSGQISFPGGKFELTDKSLEETAIRETYEEIGIDINKIQVIGKLTELHIPISGFLVHPFVAWSESTLNFTVDKNEVEYLIFITLNELLNMPVSETSCEYKNTMVRVPFYNIQNEMVWGATSMILSEFIEVLQRALKSN